jgi:DNA invertase Pin-like site-specific DNA recombinase
MAARARGRSGGRKPALDDKQIKEIGTLMKDKSIEVSTIAKRYGVSRATVCKYSKLDK